MWIWAFAAVILGAEILFGIYMILEYLKGRNPK
jgi:hypothetical protein